MRKKPLIKLVISAVLLVVLFSTTDIRSLAQTLMSIPLWVVATVFAGYVLGQLISAYKWRLIARSSGIHASYPEILKAYFSGMFVNCFGFGLVGGDIARGMLIARGRERVMPAIASVVADRAHGLCTLAAIGLFTVIVGSKDGVHGELTRVLLGVVAVIGGGWFIGPSLITKFFSRSSKWGEKAADIAAAFPRNLSTIVAITVLSIVFHSIQISLNWVIGLAFGVELSLLYLFAVIPLINILSSLPISWNGLGVRENAYIFFFAPQYLTVEQAAAIGAVWLLAITLASAMGGIVALINHDFTRIRGAEGLQAQP